MDLTVVELTAAITAAIYWLTIVDLMMLANVACWYCITGLIQRRKADG